MGGSSLLDEELHRSLSCIFKLDTCYLIGRYVYLLHKRNDLHNMTCVIRSMHPNIVARFYDVVFKPCKIRTPHTLELFWMFWVFWVFFSLAKFRCVWTNARTIREIKSFSLDERVAQNVTFGANIHTSKAPSVPSAQKGGTLIHPQTIPVSRRVEG